MNRRYLYLAASALALAPSVASAQDAADTGESAQTRGDPATSGNTIIVTGEKVDRSLQDTASSVAVTTDARIADENIQTLQEVFSRTANVSETYGSTGFTIRGIANRGVSGAGDAPLATIYVDGAALPQQIVGMGPTDLWDAAQVEIFRGPQSTLQGLNSLAGSVIIRTQDPTMHWSGRGRVTIAEYDTTSFAGAFGGPIVGDQLAFRVAAEKRDSDGFIENITRGEPEDPTDSLMMRGKLLFTPAGLPEFTARLGYTHFEQTSGYDFSYADLTAPDAFDNRVAESDFPNLSDTNVDMGALELTYDLGGALTLSSVTSLTDVDLFRTYDADLTAAPLGWGETPDRSRTWTEELRLNYESDWLSGLIGAYFYNRRTDNSTESLALVPTPVETAAQLLQQLAGLDEATALGVASLYAQALPVIPVQYASDYDIEVTNYALFGDARVRLADRLTALVGFRWDNETNEIAGVQTTAFAGVYPDPAAYGPLAPLIAGLNMGVQGLVDQAAGEAPNSKRTFRAFLPKAGLEFEWTPDIATSFVVQRGYRSGGSSSNVARSQTFPYDPEYTWNYEFALRSQWLDGTLTANANAFYIDWTDQQASVNFGQGIYDTHTVNAGKSHLYGFELELFHRPSRTIDWYASVGHVRTRFDEFTTDVGTVTDLSGLEFIYAPRWTLAAGVNVRTDFGLDFNLNANHRTKVFTDVSRPQDQWLVGARTVVNARIGYDAGPFGLSLFANNLFDEEYVHYNLISDGLGVLGDPRVIGVLLEAEY